jgi:hypothetical protein
MTTQALSMPLDITWQRLGYSRDMLDTSFGDLSSPPKWRSSLAIYSYVVPQEQTAESYPDARIVYLRLTCSITGWNLNEELRHAVNLDQVADKLDDLQRGSWEAIQSDGWARTYSGCLGAIAQLSVFPSITDGQVPPDDFPHILDFEPKKRELYETATEGGEFLSASSSNVNVQKGTTKLDHTEKTASAEAGFSVPVLGGLGIGGAKVSGQITKSNDNTTVDMRTTDNARERREMTSFSSTFSQMYQLFTGYHLGTNRALFVIAPRPHTASSGAVTGFNLLEGDRKLEGIQDMFVVVYVPAQLDGICVQASLDTGHKVSSELPPAMVFFDPEPQPNGEDENIDRGGRGGGRGGGGGGGDPEVPEEPDYLVVTRRVIQNCGRFSKEGQLVLTGVPAGTPPLPFPPRVVFEAALPAIGTRLTRARLMTSANAEAGARAELVNQINASQKTIMNAMLSGFSAGQYKPRPLGDTRTFRRLVNLALRRFRLGLDQAVSGGHLSQADVAALRKFGARTIGDLFGPEIERAPALDRRRLNAIRNKVVQAVLTVMRRN